MGGELIPKKQIFIVTTGYVPAYKRVKYKFKDKEFVSWFSSEALLNFLFEHPGEVHVVVVHPDNPPANQGFELGFKEGEFRLEENRPSIREVFSNCASIHQIKVKDEKTIREEDLLAAFSELDDVIDAIGYPAEITYDLTHSYRHLAFVILLQSFYLQSLKKGLVEIKEIFYAFAKQPLQELDEVSYIDLGQLFLTILNTQVIKDAIHELRPFPLRRYANDIKRFKSFLIKAGHSAAYVSEVEKKVKDISRRLFLLQNGFFEVEDIRALEKSMKLKKKPTYEWDLFISRFIEALMEELSNLLSKFRDEKTYLQKHHIMLILSEMMFERQDDLNKAYAFLRESIVQFFIDKTGLEVKEADRAFSRLTSQATEVPLNLRHIKDLFSQIGNTRNELQHLGMGKTPAALSTYEKHFKTHHRELQQIYETNPEHLLEFVQNMPI